jgi:hypothetical protein
MSTTLEIKTVADEIRQLIDSRDRRFRHLDHGGMNFMVSMGLLVRDPAERQQMYQMAVGVVLVYASPVSPKPPKRGHAKGA